MRKQNNNAPSWGRLNNKTRDLMDFSPTDCDGEKDSRLPYGNGRSYGDSCHNDQGTLIHSSQHNTILSFDADSGVLRAQSGVLLSDILEKLKNTGWFLPVVPGTKFVTLGGAIANDIHGKNHHKRGTFGRHVVQFTLATSDGQIRVCSRDENADYFAATIGGMGLTGFITESKIKLLKVPSHQILESKIPFGSIDEFVELSEEAEQDHEYSVAWSDSLATGKSLGKGVLISGDHTSGSDDTLYGNPKLQIPITPPLPLVAGLPLRAFNFAYYHANSRQVQPEVTSPNSFFFPLDAIGGWNRLYGPRGLFQHQCALPLETGRDAMHAMIRASQLAKHGSFLTVLKRFGAVASPGLLSFPKPGFTLTLDFPNKGEKTRTLLNELDAICLQAGGRVNPYKDARMSAQTFQMGYPNWLELEKFRDPVMMSDFWKRVTNRAIVTPPPIQTDQDDSGAINHSSQPAVQKRKIV